jgi:hypothetical protein
MVAYAAYLEIAETFSLRTTPRMVATNLEINSTPTLSSSFRIFLLRVGLRDEESLRSSAKAQFAGSTTNECSSSNPGYICRLSQITDNSLDERVGKRRLSGNEEQFSVHRAAQRHSQYQRGNS